MNQLFSDPISLIQLVLTLASFVLAIKIAFVGEVSENFSSEDEENIFNKKDWNANLKVRSSIESCIAVGRLISLPKKSLRFQRM